MSTFAYATASKGLLLWTGLVSVIGSTFGRKYLFHLQLSPHITRDHQFWRLISRNLAFTNSIDLLVSILLLYRASVLLEQRYGTAKFVSFAMVSSTMGTALEMIALFAGHRFGLNFLPAGPYTLVFSILYNYSRSVPTAYTYKIFGAQFSSKSLTYILSLLLVFAVPPNSIVSAACGILAGMMYRANVLGSRQWRVPKWLGKLSSRFVAPLLGATSIPRRSTRTGLRPDRTEMTPRPRGPLTPGPTRQGAISEVMQTFASTRTDTTPSAEAVAQLRAMFPNATTEQVNFALQRGGNDVSRSVEYLL